MLELLNVDCMEYMATQPDNAFDLAIVDPPYGIGNNLLRNGASRTKLAPAGKHRLYDNSQPPPAEYFEELRRVSKNQVIWGANHFADRFGSASPAWIIWDKETTGNFADCELAYTSFSHAARKFTYAWNGMIQGAHGNKRLNEKRIHPSQKPVKLYDWILHQYAEKGQRILDTHLGSGSSAIAAHYFGCDFVGCEIDGGHYQAASDRISRETRQVAMF